MYIKCCVPGCPNSRQDAFLHKFPSSEKRLKLWLDSINCDSLRSKSIGELAQLQVCHKHFEARFVTPKSRLLGNAYPSLFLESEIRSGTPLNPNIEYVNPVDEHSYAKKPHVEHSYCKEPPKNLPKQVESKNNDKQVSSTSQDNHHHTVPSSDAQVTKTPKQSKKRHNKVVNKIETLTPKCRKIYNEYRKSTKLLSLKRRCKKALRFSKEEFFEEKVAGMNPYARKIFDMQVKMCTKKMKARRFTLDEKLISLSILKQGPKSYRFLQKIFILPSHTTLRKLVAKLNVNSGINPQIFECIKEEVQEWPEEKKYCSIIFDEMALDTALTYTFKDEIRGFVELPGRKKQFADHVLVFLMKGVVHKWQQPIAYYFCEGATSGAELKSILKKVVTTVGETGLIPLALVSDQGASFQSALKNLKEETRKEQILENKNTDDTIEINGFTLHVIFDPPHLIKGLRNNFLTKNISFDGKLSKWSDIVEVYQTDSQHTETRLLHKLNDEHVIPEKIKKMKVKNCVRVFSKTVAGALNLISTCSHYCDGKEVSSTLKNTAEVVSFFDDLFDSVNGSAVYSKKSKGKKLRSAVTATSAHHKFWAEALIKLEKLKFIDKNGRECYIPSVKNWMSTLQSYQRLWQFLSEKNIKIMRPRFLNSDAIENYFGQVRAYNFRDNNPTCHNFENTFKALLITGFIKFHHTSFNCENDQSKQLLKIKSLFNKKNTEKNDTEAECETVEPCIETHPISMEARRERLNIQSRAYTAGWVVRKIISKNKCRTCKGDLLTNVTTDVHKWISQREYNQLNEKKLAYPAEHIVRYFGVIFGETNKYLEANAHKSNISKEIIKEILQKNDFARISCQMHKNIVIDALLTITIKLCIHNWCNILTKILKGTDIIRLQNKILPEMQEKALNKYKKKLKKKNK